MDQPAEGALVVREPAHELLAAFEAHDIALNSTLVEMLNEHFSHRTERRGCGYTQATRHLAVLVNQPRERHHETIAKLFPRWSGARSRHLDDTTTRALQQTVRELAARLEREESRLLAHIIADLVVPAPPGDHELPPCFDELKVGTCPLAEKYFLEIADRTVRRKGRLNVLVSEAGTPLLIEKVNLGDSQSCVSVTELVLNGVRLPPGCLFAVQRPEDVAARPNRALPGSVIPLARCTGFRFLRLTTLAVSPASRARAFTAHFQAQLDAPLYRPGEATVAQLLEVAQEQL